MDDRRPSQIDLADAADIPELVRLEALLFEEDAGVHDSGVDLTWPRTHGRDDFESLLAKDTALVLVARSGDRLVGHLVGYLLGPHAARAGARSAELRSLYVERGSRRGRTAAALVDEFLRWACDEGADFATVTAYAGNNAARSLYGSLGFTESSVVCRRQL